MAPKGLTQRQQLEAERGMARAARLDHKERITLTSRGDTSWKYLVYRGTPETVVSEAAVLGYVDHGGNAFGYSRRFMPAHPVLPSARLYLRAVPLLVMLVFAGVLGGMLWGSGAGLRELALLSWIVVVPTLAAYALMRAAWERVADAARLAAIRNFE